MATRRRNPIAETAQDSHDRSVRIGCSGWQYKHWKDSFYPAEIAQTRWLEF
jgi:hypothetical protein